MSRKRMISPEFYTDEKVLDLPIPGRLLFIGMWNHADDEGILKNSPKQLKVQVYPADESITINVIIEYIEKMAELKLVTKGTNIDDSPLLKITKWLDHQKINRPTPSKYVFTPSVISEQSVRTHGTISEDSVNTHGGLTEDSRLIEDNIKESNRSKDNIKESAKKNLEKQKQDFTFSHVYDIYPIKKSKVTSEKAFNRITKKNIEPFMKGLSLIHI